MHNNTLKSAVVGLGIGSQHALAILGNPSCTLSRIVDLEEKKIDNFIAENNLSMGLKSSFSEVIQDKEIKLVSLASFDDAHYEQVMASLQANKNVFVEKPLCQTREELKNIHEIFLEKKCGIASNLVLRTSELYRHVKKLIDEGLFGEIYAFDGDYLYGRVHKITEGWRKDIEHYSIMEGGGIHMIDLMIWLTSQKPIDVISKKNKIATRDSAFRYHDFQSSLFSFESGLVGKITANFGCVHRHQHVVRIFGTQATFIYDDMGARIHWNRDEASRPELIEHAPKPYKKAELIHEFVGEILKDDFYHLAKREFDLMSVVLSADEAINQDKPLKIEYLK